jgi:hypothetical protein
MSFKLEGSAGGSTSAPNTSADLTAGMVAAGLALQASMQAGQSEGDAQDAGVPAKPEGQPSSRSVMRSRIKRRPARIERRPRAAAFRPEATQQVAGQQRDTNSELRDWLKENASLLSNASLLISISAIALKALPAEGVLNPYIQALIFAAALTLLVEMHHQWPDDLQLHAFRRASFPHNHSRRMTAFAVLMQMATGLFAAWAALTNPLILFPLAAFGIFLAFRQWYFRRFTGWTARIIGAVVLILVLLVSQVMIALAWAIATGGEFTIILGDRPPT